MGIRTESYEFPSSQSYKATGPHKGSTYFKLQKKNKIVYLKAKSQTSMSIPGCAYI